MGTAIVSVDISVIFFSGSLVYTSLKYSLSHREISSGVLFRRGKETKTEMLTDVEILVNLTVTLHYKYSIDNSLKLIFTLQRRNSIY